MVFGDEKWGSVVARRHLSLWTAMLVGVALLVGSAPGAQAGEPVSEPVPDSIGVVDTEQGLWWLRDGATGATTSFYFGDPGDAPFAGDWNCDGVDTPGLYRQSDGYVYLRNTNTQGIAHTSYFFGDPGDIPLAGDFNGDGCDTVSLFRPSTGHFYVINRLGSGDAGLGAADTEFPFGAATDTPFVGDFDNNGIDSFGMHTESTGVVQLRNEQSSGIADISFSFGDRGDVVIPGRWAGGEDVVGLFRESNTNFYLPTANPPTPDMQSFRYGTHIMTPISGAWGALPGGDAEPVVTSHVVSQYTTYHPSGEARNININLIADMTDGAVVLPGETFSLNERVGQRTEEKGFVRAGAIIGGVIYCCDSPVNIGGGTSQFATTLYNAIFFGAYDDVYHRPHSLYFSRYPVVREATLGWTGPDVQFRNDTAFPVTIHTSHTSTSITVALVGDNEHRSVTTSTVGEVSSTEGGRATVYRTIYYANGTATSESWTHTYREKIAEDEEPPPPPPPPP